MELQTSRSGAGGKIVTNRRKVRIAASASPYVRPPQPSPLKSPNWFSGVVFPSARAIASGAGKILSAIFSDSDSTSSDEEEDIASEDDIDNDNLPGISCDQENTLNEKNVTSSEMMMQYKQEPRLSVWKSETKKTIEQLIMTETFSREEHDRLIKVIDSRVIDGSMDSGEKSSCAGPWNKLDENAGNFDKAVQEAKRWFQEKKARLSSGTELPQGSNLNSTMLEHVETGGGSPEDVVRSYMKTRPSWASSSERSFVSGSWDIQEELRRVRSRETEDTLSSPGKTYSSHFQVAQMRMGSARACEEVFAMGETMIEPQSAGLHRPSEALSSKPDISVSINNKVPGDVQADAEFSTSKLIHPSSPDHAEDPHSDLMENNTSNGNIINVEGVCVLLSEAHMEIPDITETSASGALVPYETETSTSGELVLYEEQSRDLSQPYAMVLYEERSLDITQPSAMVLYEERSLDIAQPSAIEKHITARKKRGRKAMKYYNTRSRGKR